MSADGWGKFGAGCLGVLAGMIIAAEVSRDDLDDRLADRVAERVATTFRHQLDATLRRERQDHERSTDAGPGS